MVRTTSLPGVAYAARVWKSWANRWHWYCHWMTWVTLLFAFQFGATASASSFRDAWRAVLGSLCGYLILSLAIRSRWIVPLTSIGAGLGLLLGEGAVRSGTFESQMWETVQIIAFGATFGVLIGFAADGASSQDAHRRSTG